MMASWMNNLRALGGNRGKNNNNNPPPSRESNASPSGYGQGSLVPPTSYVAPASPSLSPTATSNDHSSHSTKTPIFFREDYATFIVKGNFMTLAAKPYLMEEGEWLAHQIVEQTRLLGGMIKCVQGEDRSSGRAVCNEQTCPAMTAGIVNYPWIDTKGNPINLPAATYIKHIQTWVNGKIQDPSIFPTDTFTSAPPLPNPAEANKDPNHWLGKTSGFPQRFEAEIKNMYKQMFRCYAHLYWQHWITYWELSAHKELNTCFVHFMNVGRLYSLLTEKDIEPMAPLVELWTKNGVLPAAAKSDENKLASPTSASTPTSAGAASLPGASPGTAVEPTSSS